MSGNLLTFATFGLSALAAAARFDHGATGHRTEPEEAGHRAPWQAPARFDPAAVIRSVLIGDWAIREFPTPPREVIVGTVWGHPHIADGRRMHTTELIGIDEKLGWVRSLFTFYRLGQRTPAAPLQPNDDER
jgi:hypothetical protein